MKKSGSSKWLAIVGVLAVVVALGAAACGSTTAAEAAVDQSLPPGAGPQVSVDGSAAGVGPQSQAQRRENAKERRDEMAERHEALVENLLEDMSAEDQALYAQLKASIEAQRAEMREARQELADTLKELRALVDKYLELEGVAAD